MANIDKNQRTQLYSPKDDIRVLDTWKAKYTQYTEIEKMGKWKAMERIAKESGGKSPSNVNHWLFKDVGERENAHKKKYHAGRKEIRKERTPKDQSAATMYAYRNIPQFLEKAFENTDTPLTLSEITYRIQDEMRENGRYPVLIKPGTLLDKVEKYNSAHKTALLELVESNGGDYYKLAPKK